MTHAVDVDIVPRAHVAHVIAVQRGARPTDNIAASHQLAFCASNVHDGGDGREGEGKCGQKADSEEELHFGRIC